MKVNWNWDLLDTLRTVLLTLAIMANLAILKMAWQSKISFYEAVQNSKADRALIKQMDSVQLDLLRAILKGQINTHDIQSKQLKVIDSLKIKK